MSASTPPLPFLFVGLGNPGREYRGNRHNAGFRVLDRLAASLGAAFTRTQAQALFTDARLGPARVLLAKPQTYMNLVGRSVGTLVRFYRVPLDHLMVVCDDLDLPLGTLRLRPAGGTGGHKGLASIVENLGAAEFPRLRFGIGRPPGAMDPADYVLQDFGRDEEALAEASVERAVECAHTYVLEGLQAAMTRFNAAGE